MTWDVEYTDTFGQWWDALSEEEQISMDTSVWLLEMHGPQLGYPHTSQIQNSKHAHIDAHLLELTQEGLLDG